MGFLGGSERIRLPMQETRVPSLGGEDALAWRIPWTEEPGSHKELDRTERLTHTHTHTHTHTRGRGCGEDTTAAVRYWKVCPEEKGSGPFSKAAEWD